MKILIVDDDDISLTLMSRILQKGGYETVTASCAKNALEHLESGEAIMLMILDVMMPEMNGLEFLENINTRPGLSDIPVIICSGDRMRDSVVRSIKMGVCDYILKPIDAYELRFLLGRLQGGAISLGAGRLSEVLTRISDSLQGKEVARLNDMLIALQREFNVLC